MRTSTLRFVDGHAVEGREPPRAPARVMQLVELIAGDPGAPTLAQLAARMEVPKTSLMHMLRALEQAGYVARTSGGYCLGSATYRVAAAVGARNDFTGAARQALQDLAAATRETVLVGCLAEDGQAVVYLDRIASPQTVRFTPELNEPRRLHCTAVGKVMLAWASPQVVTDRLRGLQLERFTERTITTRPALRAELAAVRRAGFARSLDEMVEGGGALAVPVRAADGSVPYALVIAAPTHRILPNEAAWVALLERGASTLSAACVR
ncbi:MAG TPA: IclR family transcriptional regulator [Ramlibacter sp.]|nr:IclR family transcriptional regulator [Ramlibacter sp.]